MRKNPVDENSLRKASALLARQWVAEAEKALDCAALIEEAVKGVEHIKIS